MQRIAAIRAVVFSMVVSGALVAGLAAQASKPPVQTKAPAQSKDAASDKSASDKAIVANENKINEAVAKGDAGAFKALVASDAWSMDGGGMMSVADFLKNLKQFKLDPGWKITDTKVLWIASNTAVLTYKWTGKGTYMGQPIPPVTFASTVWHKSGDKWMAMFHQETPAAAPGK